MYVPDDEVCKNLIGYIERGEFRPVVAKTYSLAEIVRAQQDFLTKRHAGKLVLIPPPVTPWQRRALSISTTAANPREVDRPGTAVSRRLRAL